MSQSWYQQALTPSEVYEANIRLGLIPSQDHAQVMFEMKDPMTGILIAQWSKPHVGLAGWMALLEQATAHASGVIGRTIEPF